MDRVMCPACGVDHDLSEMEPSYRWPDAYLDVPVEERYYRTIAGSDDCRVRDEDEQNERFFLRANLPMKIRGEKETCSWGIWVEVNREAFGRVRELWEDPDQANEPPFSAILANALRSYSDTLGSHGSLHLTGPTTAPMFFLSPDSLHPLATEQRAGVYPERVVEWLAEHCGG